MKRFISVGIAIVILFSVSIAYAIDYSSISDEELENQFYSIRNELTSRKLKTEKKVFIMDEEGIQIYIDGSPTVSQNWYGELCLIIPVVIVNNSEIGIQVSPIYTSVNGWMAIGMLENNGIVDVGKKRKAEFEINLDETDIKSLEDFDDFETSFMVHQYENNRLGDTVIDEASKVLVFASQIN